MGIVFNSSSFSLGEPGVVARILEECGCPAHPSWVVGRVETEEGGYEAASVVPFSELDSLIVEDDLMALGVDKRLREMHISIPGDLKVVTFWNRGSRLRLTLPFERFETDVEEQARVSLQMVQDAIKGQRIAEPHVKIVPVLDTGRTASGQVKQVGVLRTGVPV